MNYILIEEYEEMPFFRVSEQSVICPKNEEYLYSFNLLEDAAYKAAEYDKKHNVDNGIRIILLNQ